ncbi:PREDICTED: crossover junction endonuclease [Prunus dulcis]|uniref:PREDICTED: crossover junction endonuclease n=1 Tax=Prunus dulcis TaxID=3755 RepID=A0A5E4EW34_PRUDU|nr:crossover junction endonuclease EME1B-like [Prunus dulcis]VVA19692.1 PREDICTED: crossover junction endonuclease [Prunus dulcis]
MSKHQQPIVLSDEEEEENDQNALSSPPPFQPFHCSNKKRRTELYPYPNFNTQTPVLVLDDDDDLTRPTRKPPGPTSPHYFRVLDESPCSKAPSDSQASVSDSPIKFSGINDLVFLESDNESESSSGRERGKDNKSIASGFGVAKGLDWSSRFVESTSSLGHDSLAHMSEDCSAHPVSLQDAFDINQVLDYPPDKENRMDQMGNIVKQRRKTKAITEKSIRDEAMGRRKMAKEGRIRLMEEKNLKKQQEKLQRAALKAEAAEMKKIQKEQQKREKGKFAVKSIVAEIDLKVVELGSVGGNLLTRFAERGITYRITSNPIERSIVWTMTVPEHISQSSPERIEIQYVLLVYEAEEFCNLVINESLLDHVFSVRSRYPSYTVCYLTNRLMAYINKREQEVYKNLTKDNDWRRPPVEEVLAKLTTNFFKVHSRQCIDEAELAEHIVGLTCSLSSCQFRKKLTRLDVNANGPLMIKDCVDRNIINKSAWLKALVAIPKVQPRFAIAIWKKYATMKSLLSVYMDQNVSVHQKEFLLKDLVTEGLLRDDRRVGEVCSKRVYRILMAQSGSIKTDDVEDGADLFRRQLA